MPTSTEADKETVRRVRAYLEGKNKEKIPGFADGKLKVLRDFGFKAVPNELAYGTLLAIKIPEEIVLAAKDGTELKASIAAYVAEFFA